MQHYMTQEDFQQILDNISYEGLKVILRYDQDRPYLQVECKDGICNVTGKPLSWRGRKWMLSPFMCVSEVVRTAFKAITTALEHEVCEKFRYKNVAIYDPHRNVELLVELASHTNAQDTRD